MKRVTLDTIMKNLVDKSKELQPVAAGQKLSKGLRILVKQDEHGTILAIGRDDTYPSDREWATVLQNMPYYVPQVTPIKRQRGTRHFLIARIPESQQPRLI